jgi:3-methyladenine DNA glycosylase AlkD
VLLIDIAAEDELVAPNKNCMHIYPAKSIFKKMKDKKNKTPVKAPPLSIIKKATNAELTAKCFAEKLKSFQSGEELKKIQRYFKSGEGQYGEGDQFIGVRMGQIFELAKAFAEMPVIEIEKLLESPVHEIRAGAVSIMDKAARNKKITENRRKDFFELYIRRHDRINNWDLVDLGSLHMTGSYLFEKPRTILYKLVRSKNLWERRTAILSTCYFIRQGDLEDTFKLAEILLNDTEDMVHKAAGWMLRFAGSKDPKKLQDFLDKYAAQIPRTMLRNAIEQLNKKQKEHYLKLK